MPGRIVRALTPVVIGIVVPLLFMVTLNPGPLPGDVALTRSLQGVSFGWVVAGADALIWPLGVALVVGALLLRRWTEAAFLFVAGVTSVVLGDGILKPLVARPRPTPQLVQVYEKADGFGFPSTTALFAVVLLGMLVYLASRSLGAAPSPRSTLLVRVMLGAVMLLVLAVSLSRVYMGVHWASDVIGSWLIGAAWLVALIHGQEWWRRRRSVNG